MSNLLQSKVYTPVDISRLVKKNRLISTFTIISAMLLVALPASAHVKWFAPYDVIADPKTLATVLTPSFYIVGIISVAVVFIAAWLDRSLVSVNKGLDNYRTLLTQNFSSHYEFDVLRYTLIVFFTAVWTLGGVVLTPELKHESSAISSLQLLILFSLMFKRTAVFAGLGVFLLWFYSAYHYGFFHLSDYMIFLGIAIFIMLSSLYPDGPQANRFIILYAAISFTLQWASIEKFVYPHWSYPLLETHPHLAMGLTKESFMDVAGFGEFVLAFLLISVTGFSFVGVTLVLGAIFIAAIYDFGKVDAIGHLAIIVALFMMAMHGPSKLNHWFSNLHQRPVVNAFYVTLLYCVSLVLFFVIYYLIRKVWLLTAAH